MNEFRKLKSYYWGEKKRIIISMMCLMSASILSLVYPQLLKILIDRIFMNGEYELVWKLCLVLLVTLILKSFMQFMHGFTGARIGNKVILRLRNACYEKLHKLPYEYYDKNKTGDLISRITSDLEMIRNFIGFDFVQFINMGITILLGMTMMFWIQWQLALLTLVTVPFLIWMTILFEKKMHPAYRKTRQNMGRLTSITQESITGIKTIQSFQREHYQKDRFSEHNESYCTSQVEASRIVSKYYPVIELLSNMCLAILIICGGLYVLYNRISIGDLVAMISLTWIIISPMWWIGFHINKYTMAKASAERVLELLEYPVDCPKSEKIDSKRKLLPSNGYITFQNVTFQYGDNALPALRKFSHNNADNKVLGILGSTGSGKSSIINLLLRAYHVKEGMITIDQMNVNDLEENMIQSIITPVFQNTILFSSSIWNNIAYGVENATEEQVIRAAKLACAHDFICRLPLGYQTVIGDRGGNLSGGQRQRISLARALIRDTMILLLDDATSAVDIETEVSIQDAIKEARKDKVTIIISNKISSLRYADEILVLNKGELIQKGTHDELVRISGPYLDTYYSQYDEPLLLSAVDQLQMEGSK